MLLFIISSFLVLLISLHTLVAFLNPNPILFAITDT